MTCKTECARFTSSYNPVTFGRNINHKLWKHRHISTALGKASIDAMRTVEYLVVSFAVARIQDIFAG